MIAVLSDTTKSVLHILVWPLPFILSVLWVGGLLLLAARIVGIEKRSYLRAVIIAIIGLSLALAAEPVYTAVGLSKWVSSPIDHVLLFLPIPKIFQCGFRKSLIAFAIAIVLIVLTSLLFAGLTMALGLWPK
jgi:hypothetical protein